MTPEPMVASERALTPPRWRPEEWEHVLLLLREWFVSKPEDWTVNKFTSYALGLADFSPQQVAAALKRLRDAPGKTFLPRVSEIADAIHTDRSDPSFAEAFELLFGKGGAVRARPTREQLLEHADHDRAVDAAIMARAMRGGELVAAFVAALTPRRLRLMPIEDPDYGELRREDLRKEWMDFVERADARRREGTPLLTSALAAQRREIGLVRPGYLAALGAGAAQDDVVVDGDLIRSGPPASGAGA